jgi:hypothetical protein
MNMPPVPTALVGGIAEIASLFVSSARYRGISRALADEVASLVPEPIRQAPCFLDRLTGLWRYAFGEPFDGFPDGRTAIGTHMYPSVDRLFDVVACARQRLTPDQLSAYLARIGDPKKHEDLLFEFAPILRLDPGVNAAYEVAGLGKGNRTVDWLLTPPSGPPIALDVKNRTKDLLESLMRVQAGERQADGTAPAPMHDPSILFTSLEPKFEPRSPRDVVQAAWIGTALKQEESELLSAFAQLDSARIHVVLLAGWRDDVYALSQDDHARRYVCDVLRVRESRRLVFRREDLTEPLSGGDIEEA